MQVSSESDSLNVQPWEVWARAQHGFLMDEAILQGAWCCRQRVPGCRWPVQCHQGLHPRRRDSTFPTDPLVTVLTPGVTDTYRQEVQGNSHCWCPGSIYSVDKDDPSSPKTIHLTSVMSTRNFFLHCCYKEQLYNWLQCKADHPISTHTNKRSKTEAMTSIYSPNFHHHSLQLQSSSFKACP